ncbi:hypothetical protein N0V90_007757 [Kalmusia sp. IMI 367209]|nr:hypothetical protein N0V90_007757 [Kalmusia sp. IMI 367209]
MAPSTEFFYLVIHHFIHHPPLLSPASPPSKNMTQDDPSTYHTPIPSIPTLRIQPYVPVPDWLRTTGAYDNDGELITFDNQIYRIWSTQYDLRLLQVTRDFEEADQTLFMEANSLITKCRAAEGTVDIASTRGLQVRERFGVVEDGAAVESTGCNASGDEQVVEHYWFVIQVGDECLFPDVGCAEGESNVV